jgi:acetate kinase
MRVLEPINSDKSKVWASVIPTDEERMIVRHTCAVLELA